MSDPAFNLQNAAARMHWEFHWGLPKTARSRRMQGPRGIPAAVAQLAVLEALELASGEEVKPAGQVHLATDAQGQALYLVAPGGVRCECPTGRIEAIRYRTRKDDGGTRWRHEFSRPLPLLTRNRDGAPVIRRAGSRFRVTWRGIVD